MKALLILWLCAGFCNAQFSGFTYRDNQFQGAIATNTAKNISMPATKFFQNTAYNSNIFSMMLWYKNTTNGIARGLISQGASTQAFIFEVRTTGIFDFHLYAANGSTPVADLVANTVAPALTNLTDPHQFFTTIDVTQTNPTNRWKVFFDGVQYTNFDFGGGTFFPTNFVFTSADAVRIYGADFNENFAGIGYQFAYWVGKTPATNQVYGYGYGKTGQPLNLFETAPDGLIRWHRAGNNNFDLLRDECDTNRWTNNNSVLGTNAPPLQ